MALVKGDPAVLLLEDGTVFKGYACGKRGEATGEVCFNTSLTGYQEIASDPSYAGQIVTMTYPQIGNYGTNAEDMQARQAFCDGFVVRDLCDKPHNFRSTSTMGDFLEAQGVVGIEGVDTRKLVRHIRDAGAMNGIISSEDTDVDSLAAKLKKAPTLVGRNLVDKVSVTEPYTLPPYNCEKRFRVVAFDCGIKTGILAGLATNGCEVVVVPYDTSAKDVLACKPDGVFVSNGPGDPGPVTAVQKTIRELLGKKPLFGICLGHQLISLAAGADIEKLKFGHHGGNQPVMNLRTGTVEITAQNHGFGQVFSSLGKLIPEESGGFTDHVDDLRFWSEKRIAPVVDNKDYGRIQLTHVNLNDGTPEGMSFLDIPAFSLQYHPEASPGPDDSKYLFCAFTRLMEGREDYLDIEVREMRTFKAGEVA
ncbi:MAG: glutamine-hydrolyzing carbamoyl-phosphate synthase small subunit [Coriobacteriaceae bacterium]|nr:glutamine-hydrolyzing carbamoyl-phosphate synthase small subunit [Coriobacteriaceae bacterium]